MPAPSAAGDAGGFSRKRKRPAQYGERLKAAVYLHVRQLIPEDRAFGAHSLLPASVAEWTRRRAAASCPSPPASARSLRARVRCLDETGETALAPGLLAAFHARSWAILREGLSHHLRLPRLQQRARTGARSNAGPATTCRSGCTSSETTFCAS
jgi:hypothetical protein